MTNSDYHIEMNLFKEILSTIKNLNKNLKKTLNRIVVTNRCNLEDKKINKKKHQFCSLIFFVKSIYHIMFYTSLQFWVV